MALLPISPFLAHPVLWNEYRIPNAGFSGALWRVNECALNTSPTCHFLPSNSKCPSILSDSAYYVFLCIARIFCRFYDDWLDRRDWIH